MYLKLTEHARNTISILYKQKKKKKKKKNTTGWNSDILNLFSEKNQFWPIFRWKSTFAGRPCFTVRSL